MGRDTFLEDSPAKGGGLALGVLVLWIVLVWATCSVHCQFPCHAESTWLHAGPRLHLHHCFM